MFLFFCLVKEKWLKIQQPLYINAHRRKINPFLGKLFLNGVELPLDRVTTHTHTHTHTTKLPFFLLIVSTKENRTKQKKKRRIIAVSSNVDSPHTHKKKMTSAEHEIDRFFNRSPHAHTPGVIPRVKADILDLMQTLRLSIRSATWGDTNQLKLCVYGGIPIGSRADYLIPVQIWMTSQYPVDPPTVYVVPSSDDQRVVSNSKVVDGTGLCYCPNLSQWKPEGSRPCALW